MSLDFLAGFTIFMLALIMVVSMVPGLLAGLESSGIDYDAVAYRTGVILVEDPGWPVYPPWEMNDASHKGEIQRIGLAVSKETPNVLLSTKVDKLFEAGFFAPEDYRNKAIFGDIPYSYNFSLNISQAGGNYELKQTGSPLPPGYGYIRRVVKIKEPGVANVGYSNSYTAADPLSPARTFTIRLDFNQLLDPKRGPAYRIDPRTEPVTVKIDLDNYLVSPHAEATLQNVTFWKMDPTRPNPRFTRIPFSYNDMDSNLYTLTLNSGPSNLVPAQPVRGSIALELQPAATSQFTLDQNSILDIRFAFQEAAEDEPQHTSINGTYLYDYGNVDLPPLKIGVLEVAIW
ncbi:hypothetical protein F8E02_02725 [Methanoculleus sp. Wushi-C6]|uniref:Uncharacterized protein n=2 Tax=Methanoculleus caldifontis TaxID=2651577 RepID=A0ABU3WYR9_9EURY|nr:hypothetical protein [Methanoculleus sp. Wushi-C6]